MRSQIGIKEREMGILIVSVVVDAPEASCPAAVKRGAVLQFLGYRVKARND